MRKNLYSQMYRQESYYWWHLAKRQMVNNFITNYCSTRSGKLKILDLGCGTGKLMQELSSCGQCYGLDYSPLALRFCQQQGIKKHYLIKADINTTLPLPENSFDIITILDVLEHTKNDQAVLKEIKRVLKPNGLLILTVPAYQSLWSYWDKMLGHKRRYHRSQLLSIFSQTKFNIVKLTYFHSFVLIPAILIRRFKSLNKHSSKTSDFIELPKIINKILLLVTNGENKLLQHFNLPFGLSLFAIVSKNP